MVNQAEENDSSPSQPDEVTTSEDSDWLESRSQRGSEKKQTDGRKRGRKRKQGPLSNKTLAEDIRRSSQLPVTCGCKEGLLDKDKYNNSEACVLSGEQWFTPPQFEKFGGKESYKKWKISILYQNLPLQRLIQEGFLSSPSFKQKAPQKKLRKSSGGPRRSGRVKREACTSPGEQSLSSLQLENFDGKKSKKKRKRTKYYNDPHLQTLLQKGSVSSARFKQKTPQRKFRKSPVGSRRSGCVKNGHVSDFTGNSHSDQSNMITSSDDDYNEEEEDYNEDDDDEDHTDPVQFPADSFPVRCCEGSGTLYTKRFATGKFGKCIRTEEAWLTPVEFHSLNKKDGNWRRDIISHEEPLGSLLMKRLLKLHAFNCECSTCNEENLLDQDNDDVCFHCNTEEGELVCCDECPRAFHHHCLNPPLQSNTLSDEWICCFCSARHETV